MTQTKIALTHASSLLAEVLIEQMAESGIKPDSVVLLDNSDQVGSRLAYADTYLTVLDQYEYDYEDLAAVLLMQADDELEGLLQHADCYVVSHHLDANRDAVFIADNVLPASPCAIKLPVAEVATLMQLIEPLTEQIGIDSVQAVNVISAALNGKQGIETLASQTISLLNSREVENSLFPLQLAFNMIPVAASSEMELQLQTMLGTAARCSIQNIQVAAMHGMAISVSLELTGDITLEQAKNCIKSIPATAVSDEPVSPLTHCQKGSDLLVFGLHQPQKDAKRLQFWIIADSIRNGLIKNYQNILEVLLKSFL